MVIMDKKEINTILDSVGVSPIEDLPAQESIVTSMPKKSCGKAYLAAGFLAVSSVVGISFYHNVKKMEVLTETNFSRRESLEQVLNKISITGNLSPEQREVLYDGLAKIEEAYPRLTEGKLIFVFQNHDEYVDALIKDGDLESSARQSNAATSPDYKRIFFSPRTFAKGKDQAIFIIAHQFGYTYKRNGSRRDANTFAENLQGYKDLMGNNN